MHIMHFTRAIFLYLSLQECPGNPLQINIGRENYTPHLLLFLILFQDCSEGEDKYDYSFGEHDFYEAKSPTKQHRLHGGNIHFDQGSPFGIESVFEKSACTYEVRVCVSLLCHREKLWRDASSRDVSQSTEDAIAAQKSFQLSHIAYLLAVVGGYVSENEADDGTNENNHAPPEPFLLDDNSHGDVSETQTSNAIYERRKLMHKRRRELLGHHYSSVFNRDSRPGQDHTAAPESKRTLALARIAANLALAYRTQFGHTRAQGPPERNGRFTNYHHLKYDALWYPSHRNTQVPSGDGRRPSGPSRISENEMQPNCAIAAGYLRVAARDANGQWMRHAPQREPSVLFAEKPDLDIYRGADGEEAQFNEARAEMGDAPSITWLGQNYYRGLAGYPQDRQLARQYFQRAADLGDVDAQYNLGVMEDDGDGFAPGEEVPNAAERMRRAHHWLVKVTESWS